MKDALNFGFVANLTPVENKNRLARRNLVNFRATWPKPGKYRYSKCNNANQCKCTYDLKS
jgi:hypothetical protein